MKYYAHSREGLPPEKWQPLDEHLKNVAEMAAEFAKPFGGEEWAYLAGLWHDVGKGALDWQAWIRHVNEVVDDFISFYEGHPSHADHGAQCLYLRSQDAGKLLAYAIAGHHGGLPNWIEGTADAGLKNRLKKALSKVDLDLFSDCPSDLPFSVEASRFGYHIQFFTRMIYSCLVDSDWLDTERFMDEQKGESRGGWLDIASLNNRFWSCFDLLRSRADSALPVNAQREHILRDCLNSAEQTQGLFSLTVPTGGGKTLASMAFALRHAVKYGKRRIIYVVPFTSVIEQNAAVFRDMLGEDAILEHHCNFIPDACDWRMRLAIENWDAPVVVTTNVQFFDSFYSNKPSKCRKLHNVANSIVIFDEVQAIPVEKITPCLEVIKELSLNYAVTAVLCTATQPALKWSEQFQSGLRDIREMVSDVSGLFYTLKRTREEYIGVLEKTEIAARLMDEHQVLCIVNTRQHALDIFELLPESDENIHLSALMYPAHRTRVLAEVRRRLDEGLPLRVVSTQLIEAGVDVDFSCVYRSVSGIDSIAQAAGRCNRNGKLDICPVYIFDFPDNSACGAFRMAAQTAAKLFERHSGNLTSPACVHEYFADYFWKNEQRMDVDNIVKKCQQGQTGNIQFKDIASFEMIKTATISVVVALEEDAAELVNALDFVEHAGGVLRKLQSYSVQIYPYQLDEIMGWLEKPMGNVFVLKSKELYSEKTGLKCNAPQGEAFFG